MRAYFDYNATTPVDPSVLAAMLPYLSENFGNASSIHTPGQRARAAVDHARDSVADLLGARPSDIVFTSGGTEADNLALFGALDASTAARKHVITTAIEHPAVLNACQSLESRGVEVTYVAVGGNGAVDPEEIRRAIRPETVLISVMHANNETGVLQPVEEIGRIAEEFGLLFHVDAVQSAGKVSFDILQLGAHLVSISAHKIYGPKGVGALYVRPGASISPQFRGGHHERDLRPGTENVPGIVGLGRAAELALDHLAEDCVGIALLRNRLENSILEKIPAARVNGQSAPRVPGTSNLCFDGAGGEALAIALDLQGISFSTGAACSSGAVEPSHVLLAMGLSPDEARSSVRFSLGRCTTAEEVDYLIAALSPAVERLRSLSPRFPARVEAR
ncbi:MAG TPA: cysteine desulfurase family protein [Verrucomicrobiae bacterium]|nr:cysteine desulfurase family protein [Verrucomicrobiae bacterium]